MRKKIWKMVCLSAIVSTLFMPLHSAAVQAGTVDYSAVYSGAFNDAQYRHDTCDAMAPYNSLSYSLFDTNGDGIKELVFQQFIGKHGRVFWVYSTNGSDWWYMGEIEHDADEETVRGCGNGILYRESYKGYAALYYAEYNGSGFSVRELMNATYDRNGNPPSMEDLAAWGYYDASHVTELSPGFFDVNDRTLINSLSGASGSGTGGSSGSSISYNVYSNSRFGYSMSYPAWFVQDGDLPANGDGIWMAGNGARQTMSGSYNMGFTPERYFEMASSGQSVTEKEINSHSVGYYSVSGGMESYYYTELGDTLCVSFLLEYPVAEHNDYKQVIETMKNSIKG